MKLKTLKDMACYHGAGKSCADRKELKEEAIKWVKTKDRNSGTDDAIIGWIKHFFNITEGDLQCQ